MPVVLQTGGGVTTTMIPTMIPASKRAAVDRALVAVFGSTELAGITLLTGGLSSALVLRIEVGAKPYLLRVVMRVDAFNDPARQYQCMRSAAAAGIAPRVWYADADDAVSITDFVAALPLPVGKLLPELVGLIKRVHCLPCFPPLVDYMDGVDLFIRQFGESGLLPVACTAEHFRYYAEVQRVYPRCQKNLVASHNDLNPNNMLFDGKRLWLVDWEAAFANDRFVDLAIAANTFVHTQEDEDTLLGNYFDGAVNETARARLYLMRQVCHMFYAMCFLRMAAAGKPAGLVAEADMRVPGLRDFYGLMGRGEASLSSWDGQLLYARVLLQESLRMMKLPRFEESVRRLTE